MSGYDSARWQQVSDDDGGPLPHGWEMRIDETTGWPFYIDHNTKNTSWQDPRINNKKPTGNDGRGSNFSPKVREIPVIREDRDARDQGVRQQSRGGSNGTNTRHEIPIVRQQQSGNPGRAFSLQDQFNAPFTQRSNGGFSEGPSLRGGNSSSRLREVPIMSADMDDAWDEMDSARRGFSSMPPSFSSATMPSRGPQRVASVYDNVSQPQANAPTHGGKNANFSDAPKVIPVVVGSSQSSTSRPEMKDSSAHSAKSGSGPQAPTASETPKVVEPVPSEASPAAADQPAEQTDEKMSADNSLNVEERPRGRSPSPAPQHLTPLEQIAQIVAEASELDITGFQGTRKDKQFIVYEELLTRLLIKLDRIESEGRDDIRSARREAVRVVQSLSDQLEAKAAASEMQLQVVAQDSDKQLAVQDVATNQDEERSGEGVARTELHMDIGR